ncbi:MAG TPA: SDR family oxidoreductase [Aquirhabdus sp.]
MKRAIVTGASRGIGQAIARRLHMNKYEVLCISKENRTPDSLSGSHYLKVDLGNGEYAQAKIKSYLSGMGWGKLDVLVNNAGIARAKAIEKTTVGDFRDMFEVNCIGYFAALKAALPALKTNGGGSVINILSISALTGFSTMSAYCASKFAAQGMALVAAKELAKYNIRVNNVCPGPTQTDMWTQLDKEYKQINGWKTDTESEQAYMSRLLIKRMGHVDDVAAMVEFLVSEQASYITGANFKVCGGNLIG